MRSRRKRRRASHRRADDTSVRRCNRSAGLPRCMHPLARPFSAPVDTFPRAIRAQGAGYRPVPNAPACSPPAPEFSRLQPSCPRGNTAANALFRAPGRSRNASCPVEALRPRLQDFFRLSVDPAADKTAVHRFDRGVAFVRQAGCAAARLLIRLHHLLRSHSIIGNIFLQIRRRGGFDPPPRAYGAFPYRNRHPVGRPICIKDVHIH